MAWLISGPIHLALSFLISSACRESIAAEVVPQVGSVLSWAGQVLSQLRRRPCLNAFHRTYANFTSDMAAQMATAAAVAAATVAAAVTGAEVTVTADPAEPTTNRLVGIDTTIATVEAETATAAGTTRANVRTRAIATTTGARAGDTKSRSIQGALRRVCHRFTSHFFTLPSSSMRVRPRTHMDRNGIGG